MKRDAETPFKIFVLGCFIFVALQNKIILSFAATHKQQRLRAILSQMLRKICSLREVCYLQNEICPFPLT